MSRIHPVDVAASVRQRLLNRARDQGQDYQYVLGAFAVERLGKKLGKLAPATIREVHRVLQELFAE